MVPIGCSGTSVRNYHYWLRNIPEERSSHPLGGESLKSHVGIHLYFDVPDCAYYNVGPKSEYNVPAHVCCLHFLMAAAKILQITRSPLP